MTKAIPKAWLCKHCGERVDPTMAYCWNCGRDREGLLVVDLGQEESNPFLTCPECGYDLRGSRGAEVCPECGFQLKLSQAHKELFWVPSSDQVGPISGLFRSPKRMLPIVVGCWFFFGLIYMTDKEVHFSASDSPSNVVGYLQWIVVMAALLFTFALISSVLVQGLHPTDEDRSEQSISAGAGFILPWLTRGWGRVVFWLAWGFLLLGILLF
ncbi:MAG: zinc ribbon domain-containing protein [Planctomycetota bacterium]